MKESTLEKRLCAEVKKLGGVTIKNAFAGVKSLPDRSVFMPGGKTYFVEVKRQGQRPTQKQLLKLEKFRALGFSCFVVNDECSLFTFLYSRTL